MYGAGKLRLANAAQSKSANQGCIRTPAAPFFSTPSRRAGLPTSSFLIRSCNSCKDTRELSLSEQQHVCALDGQQYVVATMCTADIRTVLKKAGISYRTSQMACAQQ
jgi:hypothetical protein